MQRQIKSIRTSYLVRLQFLNITFTMALDTYQGKGKKITSWYFTAYFPSLFFAYKKHKHFE